MEGPFGPEGGAEAKSAGAPKGKGLGESFPVWGPRAMTLGGRGRRGQYFFIGAIAAVTRDRCLCIPLIDQTNIASQT